MKTIVYFLLFIGVMSFLSCEEEIKETEQTVSKSLEVTLEDFGWDYNYKLASTAEELSRLMNNPEINIVRSKSDFKRFIKTEPILKNVFSDEQLLKEIIKTMVFNKRGLQTYSYEAIKKRYPNRFKTIIEAISRGVGMDPWLTADGMDLCCDGEQCWVCPENICIPDNC
ncbi:hypothetical protein ABW636_12885 [Aquimarina sp. 2201CG1-2-11]|uniref:hypothetical protein n=1 Tax=Aquimarina discodermiae TaxID=3231043 RepID=UPI0034628D47